LTFDPAVPHTVVHHSSTCTYIPNFMEMGRKKILKVNTDQVLQQSSTSTYIPNFIQIEETLWTDGRTDVRMDGHFSPLYY